MSDVLGVRLPPNAGPWGTGAGRLGSRLRFRSTGRAWERKGNSGGSSSHLLVQLKGIGICPQDRGSTDGAPTEVGCTQMKQAGGMTEHSPTKVLGRERNPFPKRGIKREVGGLPRGASKGLSPQTTFGTELYLTGETGCPVICPALQSYSLSPLAMLTMGVLGSPSNCRGGHRKGSVEPPAVLELGKVQFLASWTGGGGPGSSQGSMW